MKRRYILAALLLFSLASQAFGELTILPPEEMIARAQLIVAGEVQEVRLDQEQPVLVLQVDKVYRGESLPAPRLVLPLPEMPGSVATDGAALKGARLLLMLMLDDTGRLVPVADLNWAAFLVEGVATRLFYGASTREWRETDYVAAINGYLVEAGELQAVDTEPEPAPAAAERSPLEALKALPLLLAGIFVLALVFSRIIRKSPRDKDRNRTDPWK